MKFTIICHFDCLFIYTYVVTDTKGSQMTNNCKFHVLLNLLQDMAEGKLATPIKLYKQ